MNFLAHQYLSFDIPEIQLGNLYGEIVRGRDYQNFPKGIRDGILLHREIDSFTDSHPIVKNSTEFFHKNHGKYSPVIVDILYDYFLIKNWNSFSTVDYDEFVKKCYSLFEKNQATFPDSLRYIIHYLLKYDWFHTYSTVEGIGRTLKGISQRASFENSMGDAVEELVEFEKELENHFLLFFPELIKHCKDFLNESYNL